MDERRRNVMVGLFALGGLIALAVLIVIFGQGPQWLVSADRYDLVIRFDSVAGIREGTPVTVKGKRIGHVRDVRFTDTDAPAGEPQVVDVTLGVEVIAAIEPRYAIPKGSRAETVEAGLLGGGRPPIEIIPGDPALGLLDPQAEVAARVIQGQTRSTMDALVPPEVVSTLQRTGRQIGDAAAELQPVLRSVNAMIEPRDPRVVDRDPDVPGNLSSAAARADDVLKHISGVLGDPETNDQLRETVENVHAISSDGRVLARDLRAASGDVRQVIGKADQLVDDVGAAVESVRGDVEQVAEATVTNLEKAEAVLDYLAVTSRGLARGEGTVGKLLRDDRLYESLALAAERLAATIDEMRLLVLKWQEGAIRVQF